MARTRDPRRDEAKKIWLANQDIKLKDLAEQLGVTSSTIRKWKSTDKWGLDASNEPSEGQKDKKTSRKVKKGAPKGNKNALNNKGGAPKGNDNATTHGFFKKIFPDDAETFEIIEEIERKSPIDILWEQIVLQYTAIARAQRIMFVQDKNDLTKVLKKSKESFSKNGGSTEEEYELQFAWDKHGNFLSAQSRAMTVLSGLIRTFLQTSGEDDQRRLQLEKMKQSLAIEEEKLNIAKQKLELDKIRIIGDEEEYEDDGFIAALNGKTAEVWNDDDENKDS
ncbi:phage terminase small subunit [Priestia flexa]|uniref:phage terminase small subunit n=1 Tax=Priestia flexa TaxID=86664 RepID=UPI002493A1D6|nr:phage terminase small subunit [Priestia flexa]